jgi:hypothetical protein
MITKQDPLRIPYLSAYSALVSTSPETHSSPLNRVLRRVHAGEPGMAVVAISDTHGQHNALRMPQGEVLIVGGDFTDGEFTTREQVAEFDRWMGSLHFTHKVRPPPGRCGAVSCTGLDRHWRSPQRRPLLNLKEPICASVAVAGERQPRHLVAGRPAGRGAATRAAAAYPGNHQVLMSLVL